MIVLLALALLAAAVFATLGIVVGAAALLIRGIFWLVFLPFRLLFSFVALPVFLGGIALFVLGVVGFSVIGALLVTAAALAAAAISLLMPVALVAGVIWLIARALRPKPGPVVVA
jgi:hypothetical protein